jgi:hypothetical protein
MANNTDEKQPAAKQANTVDSIGTLTYPRACTAFGKDRAVEVMQKVASIGGHGSFGSEELMSPLFGGLMMPSPDVVKPPTKADYDYLPDADFWFQAGLEEFETNKTNAAAARAAINEYYASLK